MTSVRINENMIVNVERSMMESYKNVMRDVICEVIRECSKNHNFDYEEECRRQGIEGMYVKVVDVKSLKSSKKEVEGGKLMLPYNGEMDECKCEGVKWYEGLMKQCNASKKEGEKYCGSCENQCKKNDSGLPTYGNIIDRRKVGLYSYVGPNGSKPVSYVEYLKKKGYSIEDAKKEALKEGKEIDDMHYTYRWYDVKKSRGRPRKEGSSSSSSSEVKVNKKGRPKKAEKEISLNDEEDIFASLVASVVSEEEVEKSVNEVECEVECEVEKSVNEVEMSSISVASESDSKKSDKSAKKAEKEAKKAEKDAIKAEKDAKKAEKEAKKAEKKATKEANKADKLSNSDKDINVAEKEVELEAEEIEEDERPKTPIMPDEEEEEEEEEPDVVKCIEYNGVKYLESKKTGVIYNYEQDVVGKRNYATGEIEFEEIESESEDDE